MTSRPEPLLAPREVFVERFALLYVEAGEPPLKRVTEAVSQADTAACPYRGLAAFLRSTKIQISSSATISTSAAPEYGASSSACT
jgi:hypothetical protein